MKKLLTMTAITSFALTSQAYAVGYIKSPYVTKNELEAEYVGIRHNDDSKSGNNKQKHIFDVVYGITDDFAIEYEAILERKSGEQLTLEKSEYELKYQLTEKGDFWWDAGLLGVFVHTYDDHKANKAEAKLLLQNESYGFRHRTNITFKREVGAGAKRGVKLGGRWYSRYNLSKEFKPGIEWQGEFGRIDDMDASGDQEHYIGPKAFGHISFLENALPNAGQFEYEAGYLFGLNDAATDGVAIFKLEYKKHF